MAGDVRGPSRGAARVKLRRSSSGPAAPAQQLQPSSSGCPARPARREGRAGMAPPLLLSAPAAPEGPAGNQRFIRRARAALPPPHPLSVLARAYLHLCGCSRVLSWPSCHPVAAAGYLFPAASSATAAAGFRGKGLLPLYTVSLHYQDLSRSPEQPRNCR